MSNREWSKAFWSGVLVANIGWIVAELTFAWVTR